MTLSLTPDELLSTTRAVRRRLDFDRPLDMELVYECLQLAIQAPTGANRQGWHFMLVTDPQKKLAVAELYRKGWDSYIGSSRAKIPPEEKPVAEQSHDERVVSSSDYLAKNMHRAPVLLIPCISGRISGAGKNLAFRQASHFGSILPAAWSFMLAARVRGLGACWTTLHLIYEEEAADVLGIPYESITQAGMIPVAHTLGTSFRPAPRKPLDDLVHINQW